MPTALFDLSAGQRMADGRSVSGPARDGRQICQRANVCGRQIRQ